MRGFWAAILGILFATVACIPISGAVPMPPSPDDSYVGTWSGVLVAGPRRLTLVFHIAAPPALSTLDSPDQSAIGIPVTSIVVVGDEVRLGVASVKGDFIGRRGGSPNELVGQWRQGGAAFALTLKRGDSAALSSRRPQEPRGPVSYRVEEVSIVHPSQGVVLAGSLTVPTGPGPFAAVLLVNGSGPQDRDETIRGHKPFLVLADYLTKRGFVVLRLDDRGIGGSTGSLASITTSGLAADAVAALSYLKSRPEISPDRVGVLGHSEGATIAAMLAQERAAAFVVLLGAPGVTGDQNLLFQQRLAFRASNLSQEAVETRLAQNRIIYDAILAAPDIASARAAAQRILKSQQAQFTDQPQIIKARAEAFADPWLIEFVRTDPAKILRGVQTPVLAITGGLDLQVPPSINLPPLRTALAGNPNARVLEIPGLNHLLQTAQSGDPTEYEQLRETLSPEALGLIGDWLELVAGE